MSTFFQRRSAKLALDYMLNQRQYFDICTVREVCDIFDMKIETSGDFKALKALHCVPWKNMEPGMISVIKSKLKEMFADQFDWDDPDAEPTQAKRSKSFLDTLPERFERSSK